MTKLETEFTLELLETLKMAEEATGTAETRLAAQAQSLGGPAAVRQLLSRGQTTRQFEPLRKQGRLELSVEALVTRGKYASLFSDQEVDLCLGALLEAGMYQ